MTVFEAISQMRLLTDRGLTFSFVFMTYSEDTGQSQGLAEVRSATLRPQSSIQQNRNAEIMLNYYDTLCNRHGKCYQPLIIEFNGIKLELT